MSKLIDNLNRVQATMTEKPSPGQVAVTPVESSPTAAAPIEPARKEAEKLPVNSTIVYSVFAAVMVIVVMALVLSYKAFAMISERNSEFSVLSSVIKKQNQKMKSLEDSILQLSSQQTQELTEIKDSVTGLEKIINKNTKEMAEMAMDHDVLTASLKDVKTENKNLRNNYDQLTAEINRVKQMFTRMVGETAPAPAQ